MRVAAIDLGTVRVGLAVADELGLLAHPRPWLDARHPGRLVRSLGQVVTEEGVTLFLIGLPRTLRGTEGPGARRARQFAQTLRDTTGVDVQLVDEWLTSKEAMRRLRDQSLTERQARWRVDSAAAAVLLQSWLDSTQALTPP
ncbi:Holliday junction resolvase RuvX [Myxococcota bacterium]